MSLDKIKGYKDHLKDSRSGAILLNNQKVANEYLLKKKELQHDAMVSEEINNIKSRLNDLDSLKNDMQEIKNILKELVSK